jgi:transcriptional regulator with XRE-family HTH domain
MNEELITRIKKFKIDQHLTNKQLASISGVSEAVIKNYLRGKTDIPFEFIRTLSSHAKKPITYLVDDLEDAILVNDPSHGLPKAKAGRSPIANYQPKHNKKGQV